MFAATSANKAGILASQSISIELYRKYREIALSLLPIGNPDLNYVVNSNDDIPGAIGYGIHEKFIHYGRSIIDLSVGDVHYPWVAADEDANNEISVSRLRELSESETNLMVATRLKVLANFAAWLPSYTRFYFYRSRDNSVKALTIEDEMNQVKFNMIVNYDFT